MKISNIKYKISNIQTKNKKYFWFLVCVFDFWFLIFGFPLFAQDNNKLVTLSQQIIEAKTSQDLYAPFKELKDLYYKDNKYSQLVEFLQSLEQKKPSLQPFTNYYIAEARYAQLKRLEETQSWDEYFAQGNTYRDQITAGIEKTISSTAPQDPLNIYARLLSWKFHKDQEDAFKDKALEDLLQAVQEYAAGTGDASLIKKVADRLSAYAEKGKSRELYKVYVDKLLRSDIKDEALGKYAADFYQEGNLELAQTLYDAYIERITKGVPKEKLLAALIDIAQKFSYKDGALNDPLYAEKIFKKIEEIGGADAFNEDLIYLRAFNLEKSKAYLQARDIYLDLLKRFAQTPRADEVNYKVGLISTYVARDINTGRSYFEKLAKEETTNPQVISSLYQLGLLSQWEGKLDAAKAYYNQLLEKAKDQYQDSVDLAQERLKEILEAKPMEYNLKTFLDVSLKDDYKMMEMAKLDLRATPAKTKKDTSVAVSSHVYLGETGCMQVEVQYLWSGHLGTAKPSSEAANFSTQYLYSGSKEINLVAVTPSGILDRDLSIVDVN